MKFTLLCLFSFPQHFLQPIRARSLLPVDVITIIFSNIEHILSLNRELLMYIQQKGPVEAFNNMGPFLKVYANYVNNYNTALDVLRVSIVHTFVRKFINGDP